MVADATAATPARGQSSRKLRRTTQPFATLRAGSSRPNARKSRAVTCPRLSPKAGADADFPAARHRAHTAQRARRPTLILRHLKRPSVAAIAPPPRDGEGMARLAVRPDCLAKRGQGAIWRAGPTRGKAICGPRAPRAIATADLLLRQRRQHHLPRLHPVGTSGFEARPASPSLRRSRRSLADSHAHPGSLGARMWRIWRSVW